MNQTKISQRQVRAEFSFEKKWLAPAGATAEAEQPHMVLAREHDEHVPEGTHIAVAPAGQVVLSLGHGSMAALTS